jgi:hypothetical protein
MAIDGDSTRATKARVAENVVDLFRGEENSPLVDSVLLPFYARTGTSSGKEMAGHFHEIANQSELSKKAEIRDTANARKGESDEVETGVTPND